MGKLLSTPFKGQWVISLVARLTTTICLRSGTFVGTRLFQLKRLWLSTQLVLFVEALIGGGIDHRNRAGLFIVAATNIDGLGRGIVAQVVGASLEIHRRDLIVGRAIVDVDLAAATGHEELVGFLRKSYAPADQGCRWRGRGFCRQC